jgi:hypothetical protein
VKIPERSKDGSKHIFPSLFVALQMDTSYLFWNETPIPSTNKFLAIFFFLPFKEFSWLALKKYASILLVK